VRRLKLKYEFFHQPILVADVEAIDSYKKCGFDALEKPETEIWRKLNTR